MRSIMQEARSNIQEVRNIMQEVHSDIQEDHASFQGHCKEQIRNISINIMSKVFS